MAEPDDASQGAADAVVTNDAALANQDDQQQADDTPEPIANLARDLGWTPRDEWQGEPDKWKPAEQFIRDGRDIQQTTARELRSVREQMERLSGVTETIVQDKVAERDAYWEAKFNEAVDAGDTEAARKAAKQLEQPKPAQNGGIDPQVAQWKAKNPWFETDHLATIRAEEVSKRLAHLPVADQLREVDRMLAKEFPELAPKPAKAPPGVQTAAARSTDRSNRVKGFADMPQASQQVALDYEKRLGVPKEKTAASYWAEQERVSR